MGLSWKVRRIIEVIGCMCPKRELPIIYSELIDDLVRIINKIPIAIDKVYRKGFSEGVDYGRHLEHQALITPKAAEVVED